MRNASGLPQQLTLVLLKTVVFALIMWSSLLIPSYWPDSILEAGDSTVRKKQIWLKFQGAHRKNRHGNRFIGMINVLK